MMLVLKLVTPRCPLHVDTRASVAQTCFGFHADFVAEETLGAAKRILRSVARLAENLGDQLSCAHGYDDQQHEN